MYCKICNSISEFVFEKKVLQKYNVAYFKCTSCGFLQTEESYWLEEAYKLPFTPLDVKIVSRPIELSQLTENLILNYFESTAKFLDYGGGVGLFTRLMRDKGLDFYRSDKYAQNLFAQYFDFSNLLEKKEEIELLTSFEVLEHLVNPLDELSEMFSLSRNIFCSTILQPSTSSDNLKSWFYIAEQHGQHISFYTQETMKLIANKFGCHYYSYSDYLHLFTPKEIDNFNLFHKTDDDFSFAYRVKSKAIGVIEHIYRKFSKKNETQKNYLHSLIEEDFETIIKILSKNSD